MTPIIRRTDANEAWDLIFPVYLSMLSVVEQETMRRSMQNSSHLWIAEAEGRVYALLGTIPPTLLSDTAYLWLYTTPDFASRARHFARISRRMIAEALGIYPSLWGHCIASAPRSIRWLRWLGADFHPPQGRAIPFELKASQWPQQLARSA